MKHNATLKQISCTALNLWRAIATRSGGIGRAAVWGLVIALLFIFRLWEQGGHYLESMIWSG